MKSAFKQLPKKAKTAGAVVVGIGAGMVVGQAVSGIASRSSALARFRAAGPGQRILLDGLLGILATGVIVGLGKGNTTIKRAAPLLAGGALLSAAQTEVFGYVDRAVRAIPGGGAPALPPPGGYRNTDFTDPRAMPAPAGQYARQGELRRFARQSADGPRRRTSTL